MMKNFPRLMAAAAVSLLLTGCGLYDKYESQAVAPADAFGTGEVIADASTNGSLADVSWREFFTDPLLQELIDSVLARNTDLNSARIAIEQSEASLKAAKLAYLPSLYFNPSGTLSSFDFGPVSKTYSLPLQLPPIPTSTRATWGPASITVSSLATRTSLPSVSHAPTPMTWP